MTTRQLTQHTGATTRQIQWWSEGGLLKPDIVRHDGCRGLYREFSAVDVIKARMVTEWRRHGVSLKTITKLLSQRPDFSFLGLQIGDYVVATEEEFVWGGNIGLLIDWMAARAKPVMVFKIKRNPRV